MEELINTLANKARLQDKERETFLRELNSKENQLREARREIEIMQSLIKNAEAGRIYTGMSDTDVVNNYFRDVVIALDPERIRRSSPIIVKRKFNRMIEHAPSHIIRDLHSLNLIDSDKELTIKGWDKL